MGGHVALARQLYERAISIVGNSRETNDLTLASVAMAPEEVHVQALAGLGQIASHLGYAVLGTQPSIQIEEVLTYYMTRPYPFWTGSNLSIRDHKKLEVQLSSFVVCYMTSYSLEMSRQRNDLYTFLITGSLN